MGETHRRGREIAGGGGLAPTGAGRRWYEAWWVGTHPTARYGLNGDGAGQRVSWGAILQEAAGGSVNKGCRLTSIKVKYEKQLLRKLEHSRQGFLYVADIREDEI